MNSHQNADQLADICQEQMVIQSILISETKDKKEKDKHERDFNNYKHYDI